MDFNKLQEVVPFLINETTNSSYDNFLKSLAKKSIVLDNKHNLNRKIRYIYSEVILK